MSSEDPQGGGEQRLPGGGSDEDPDAFLEAEAAQNEATGSNFLKQELRQGSFLAFHPMWENYIRLLWVVLKLVCVFY